MPDRIDAADALPDAAVMCRDEHRGGQRPVAVVLGGERLAVEEILDERVHGPREAGSPLRRETRVRLEDGQHLRLERVLPDGPWRVHRAAPR